MRKTLHKYLKSQYEGFYDGSGLFDIDSAFTECYKYAELTNRKPKFEDFIGENAIFKGEWEIFYQEDEFIQLRCNGVSWDVIIRNDDAVSVIRWKTKTKYDEVKVSQIEELPREIEFKENAI
jgi:hypothetical protein